LIFSESFLQDKNISQLIFYVFCIHNAGERRKLIHSYLSYAEIKIADCIENRICLKFE